MNANESKGKHGNIPHKQPGILIPLDESLADLPRGRVNSIGGDLNIDDPGFKSDTIQIPATATPLLRWLSTKHNLIDLTTKAFPCKRIENTSKKVEHAI